MGGSGHGTARGLRVWLEGQGYLCVMAMPASKAVCHEGRQRQARLLTAELPGEAWARVSASAGSKGDHLYDWALVPLFDSQAPAAGRGLLVRRSPGSYPSPTRAGSSPLRSCHRKSHPAAVRGATTARCSSGCCGCLAPAPRSSGTCHKKSSGHARQSTDATASGAKKAFGGEYGRRYSARNTEVPL